jgi:hypothetical protein
MSSVEKVVNRLLISLVFTALNWIVVDFFIVEISFWRDLIIELFLVVSLKFYTFTTRKMNL